MNTILSRAADIIRDPANWTQGVQARDKDGEAVPPYRSTACRWCARGAIAKACAEQPLGSRPPPYEALYAVEKHLQRRLWQFNDAYDTKHQDVVDLLDRAAA